MTTIVVPCYNEARRLDVAAFKALATSPDAPNLVLVNDGSRDDTLAVLNDIRSANPNCVDVLDLPRNGGKAEAVRSGMVRALETEAEFIGFWDADLATPFDALPPFVELLRARPSLEMVIGSRVRLLGRLIERHAFRHYYGRVFATAASITLQLPVYDTQCGAKVFRVSPNLRRVLSAPFLSRWVFDVEMIARYGALGTRYDPSALHGAIYELPLLQWRDVAGSKLKARDVFKSALDLVRIYHAYIRAGAPPRMRATNSGRQLSKAAVTPSGPK